MQGSFTTIVHAYRSIDQHSEDTPVEPPVALDQLVPPLTEAELGTRCKLVEMFEHQVCLFKRHNYAVSVYSELNNVTRNGLTPCNSQPIWTRRGICRSLAINLRLYGLSAQFLKLLGTVSYRFVDGPFHNSCVFTPSSIFMRP